MSAPAEQKRRDGSAAFVKWLGPLLDALRHLGGSASPREASDRIAVAMKVADSVRNEVMKSGAERFHNQVQWARQYLAWEGLIDSSQRGVWSLTPKGRVTHLSEADSRDIFLGRVRRFVVERKTYPADPVKDAQPETGADSAPPAEPQAEAGLDAQRFAAVLRSLSPTGFENLCKRLLREAGFERVEVIGRSGDGGIDGIGVLQINPLVSFTVVFQCKKWEQSVPPKEVRDLRDAMDGRAEKGIFLTTSTFSAQARSEAERAGAAPIELVDGEKLFEMFKSLQLGLKPRTVYDIDGSFFESFK